MSKAYDDICDKKDIIVLAGIKVIDLFQEGKPCPTMKEVKEEVEKFKDVLYFQYEWPYLRS